jgi:hypothetical protein
MNIARKDIPLVVSNLLDGRPTRWASSAVGNYDGRERTLEVFEADASEQLALLRELRSVRAELRAVADGPLVIVFHTRAESERLYKDFVQAWRQRTDVNPRPPHRVSPRWVDVDVREGQAIAPRRAA